MVNSSINPTIKVAVVDDSLLMQERLGGLFSSVSGVQVVGYAEDTPGAVRLIDAERPDVVVLDVELAGGDTGMSVLAHVVRKYPDTRVIALSNFSWLAMHDAYLRAGAHAYFDKATEFTVARDWIAALASAVH